MLMQWLCIMLKRVLVKKKKRICIQKASQELRESQMKHDNLLPYFQYMEDGKLPEIERNARRVMLEGEKMEVINGVLHHDSAADQLQWCVVVPTDVAAEFDFRSTCGPLQWSLVRTKSI